MLRVVNTGESNCTAIEMIDLDLNLLNVFSVLNERLLTNELQM